MKTNYLMAASVLLTLHSGAVAQTLWTQVSTSGPSPRSGHAMAFDTLRARMVLFGGADQTGPLGDTWGWDGSSWTQLSAVGPSPRTGNAVAFDSQRGRVVLFGGGGNADTWEWDGSAWLPQLFAVGPPGRTSHVMAYDSQRGRTVLFGGRDASGTNLGDTWEWNGVAWVLGPGTGPVDRSLYCMAYDEVRGRTILAGGVSAPTSITVLWLNPFTSQWVPYSFPVTPYPGNAWSWDGTTWSAIAGPTRAAHAMTYDAARERFIIHGGELHTTVVSNPGGFVVPSATYAHYLFGSSVGGWDGGTNWQILDSQAPIARGHAMAFDRIRERAVMFGGMDSNGVLLGATWEWAGATGTAATFGAGCGSPPLDLAPVASSPPNIFSTARAQITNSPSALTGVAVGWSRTTYGPFTLPLTLAGYGMPGCFMLQSTELAALPVVFTGPRTAVYSLQLPNWGGLIGLHLNLQAWSVAPGVNPGNTIVSNGLEWVVGY